MARASFTDAVADISSLRASHAETAFLSLGKLERIILDHRPTSSTEAVAMLDIAIPDIAGGGRTDGRDLKALKSIRDMLAKGMG
jgi:hypothetical protein